MRKDPLDPIDGGTKVRIALRRLLDPEAVKVGAWGWCRVPWDGACGCWEAGWGCCLTLEGTTGVPAVRLPERALRGRLSCRRGVKGSPAGRLAVLQREEERKKKEAEAAKAKAAGEKKAGAWGGLPGR